MKVYITRALPGNALDKLRAEGFDVEAYDGDEPIPRELLLKKVQDADALLPLLTDQIDKEVIDAMPLCKVIANYAVGYNNIDTCYAKETGVVVTNTPDILTDATADLAMTLALACARRVVPAHQFTKEGNFTGWKPKLFLGVELRGKTFGILGAGRIGTAVGLRAAAFGAKIIYVSRVMNTELEQQAGAQKVELDEIIRLSDFLSVHLSLNDSTHQLLNRGRLGMMKPAAILVNTARGEIIEEQAMIAMLRDGRLAAVGLDVYEGEPDLNPELFELDNVLLLPHIGSATRDTREAMANLAVDNIIAVLNNKMPLTPVNK